MPRLLKVSNPLPIINLVLDGLPSENSKRAYGKALGDFMSWYQREPTTGLTKATVQQYKTIITEFRHCALYSQPEIVRYPQIGTRGR